MATLDLSGFGAGTYTLDDDGVSGNSQSAVRNADGAVILLFSHPADALTVVSGPGQNLIFNITDSFGAATVTVGSLTDSTPNPDSIQVGQLGATTGAVILAANGTITEFGTDVAPEIIANLLAIRAGTGVGTAANALETQVAGIEIETDSGGITVSNVGAVQIGGIGAGVAGLTVTASGDIMFTNLGSILLSDTTGYASVEGGSVSGNVTLIANGYASDVTSNVNYGAIWARTGAIAVTAGQDIVLGTAGVDFGNSVFAYYDVTMIAGRDVIIAGQAVVRVDRFRVDDGDYGDASDLTVTAGRNIGVLNTATELAADFSGSHGDVVLTAGPGGAVTVETRDGVFAAGGDLIINSDRLVITATGNIYNAGGNVTLRPVTAGWAVDLGSTTDATALTLELSDAELSSIHASTLVIGSSDSGETRVTSQIILPSIAPNLTVRSGTDFVVGATLWVTGALELHVGDDLFLPSLVQGSTVTVFVDDPNADPGVGGATFINGTIVGENILNGNLDDDTLNGSGVANTLNGFAGNDTLTGFGGNDTLDGGAGADAMTGDAGDDRFFVNLAADSVFEASGEGNDRVFASVSYTLGAGQSVETLSTTSNAGTGALNLTGNGLGQVIIGNAGANVLTGGGGGDVLIGFGGNDTLVGSAGSSSTLQGGLGNDIYRVFIGSDTIIEVAGEGTDRINTSASFVLLAGREIESLFAADLASTTALNLTGNSFGQTLFGNAGANVLVGGGGGDYLIGGAGNDILYGNADANSTLQGGVGDDRYYVSRTGDSLVEFAGEGSDRVLASINYTLTAGKEIEELSTANPSGTTALNLTGNELAQTIIGNNGANILSGLNGADNLAGFGGSDILVGGDGDDTLNGGADYDIMNGGTGADVFIYASPFGPALADRIQDFVSGLDRIFIDDAQFAGLATGALPANAFRTGSAALDADDRIVYNNATGQLFFDADGNGAGAAVQFGVLSGAPALAASDFTVI